MGLISLSLPSDGDTADAADVNSPFNTIATAINGNLDNDNIKTGAGISTSKLAADGFLAAWTSYTPTVTTSGSAFSLGNGTIAGSYTQIGKTTFGRIVLTIGSTTSIGSGNYSFSLPVASRALSGSLSFYTILGNGYFQDSSSGWVYPLSIHMDTTTTLTISTDQTFGGSNPVYVLTVGAGATVGGSTVAVNDVFVLGHFIYEAA